MTYCKNFNRLCFIVDQIQDTVITDANAMAIVAVQFLDAMRTRVVSNSMSFRVIRWRTFSGSRSSSFSAARLTMTV